MKNNVGKNRFRWPASVDIFYYRYDEILCDVNPPSPVNRRGDYILGDGYFIEANASLVKLKK